MFQAKPMPWPIAVRTAGGDARTAGLFPDRRLRRRARVSANNVAGAALTIALTASAAAVVSLPTTMHPGALAVMLMNSANPFQTQIDAIAAAQQQITATNSDYNFITDFDKTLLPTYVQNVGRLEFYTALASFNGAMKYDQDGQVITYGTNAPGAEPFVGPNTWNPDQPYLTTPVGIHLPPNDQTEILTVHPGPGTLAMSFAFSPGNGATGSLVPGFGVNLSQFTPNADGSYTIVLSPTPHDGNWVDTAGMGTMLGRGTSGDWGLLHSTYSVTPEDPSQEKIVPVLSEAQIGGLRSHLPAMMVNINNGDFSHGIQQFEDTVPANTFTSITQTPTLIGPAMPGQLSSFGRVELEPDQALIVKVPDVNAGYTGFQISDGWTQDLPYVTAQSSLNNSQVFRGDDGFTYYVISGKDPGVANWIDNSNFPDSVVMARWINPTGAVSTTPITTQVVNVDDVRNYLPADMPTVTAAERATDLQTRLLEYDYMMDQYKNNAGWLTQHLEFDQFSNAVGADQFNALFGVQADVPSVLDRMTDPSLMPDLSAVAQAVFADPAGSLSAVMHNLPLLAGDVMWPMVLAALRLDLALADAPAASTLETIVTQTLSDPATSITAGLLNARDDLAVSLMHSSSYNPLTMADLTSAWDGLLGLGQSASQALSEGFDLLMPTTGDATSAAASAASDLVP